MSEEPEKEVLAKGRFIQLVRQGNWEYTERIGATGVVVVVALTEDGRLLFTEQFRPPVAGRVIELPAGLAGDEPGHEDEDLASAARRELLEETGYEAGDMIYLSRGPSSSGLTSEVNTFFLAPGVRQVHTGGGNGGEEKIQVHAIPLGEVADWLKEQEQLQVLIEPRVYAALYFANLYCADEQ